MAKGFAAGLAKGLQDAEDQSLKRAQEDRVAAIQTAQVGMQMEDQTYKRGQREEEAAFKDEMSSAWSRYYGRKVVEEEEPIPGAIPTDDPSQTSAGMVRKVQREYNFVPGERSAEGRQRDMAFFNEMTSIRSKYKEFSPEQMKQATEYGRFLEKEGIEDGLSKLILTNDPSGLAPLAARLGVDPNSLTVESVNNKGVPSMVLVATDANGKPIRKDLEEVLFSIGIKNLSEATDKKLGRRKAIADIDYTEAKTDDAKADATYARAQAAETESGKVNTAEKDYLPKLPTGETKPVIDPGAGNAKRLLSNLAERNGMNTAKADRWAKDAHARISAAAQQKVEAEEQASGKKYDAKTYNEKYSSHRTKILNDYIERTKKTNKQAE